MSDTPDAGGQGGRDNAAMLRELARHGRRAYQLLRDKRVPTWHKLIPVGALAYLISPIDLVSELLGPLGVVDDIVVLLVALRLFNHLAGEHVAALPDGDARAAAIDADYRVREADSGDGAAAS